MQIVGSDSPLFYKAAVVMREYLPDIEFMPSCKIMFDDGRYYGLITKNGNNVMYDHVVIDKFVCNPEIIFIVMTTLFSFGSVVNTFIDVNNKQSERFVQGVGFKHTGILRGQPKDLAIWSMTAAEWATNKIRLHYIKQKPENTSDLA
jgi:hypothetical protein